MKYLVMVALVLAFVMPCSAGMVWYEKGDLKIGVSELSAGTAYDINAHDWLAVAYTSVVQYKTWNLDLGYIGELDNLDQKNGVMVGLSTDLLERNTPVKNLTANVGIFTGIRASDIDDISSSKIPFGIYTSMKVAF